MAKKAGSEGYGEDVVKLPSAGFDDARFEKTDSSFVPSNIDGVDNKFSSGSFEVVNPHLQWEPGENNGDLSGGDNDFPRETGHDSLTEEEAQLS